MTGDSPIERALPRILEDLAAGPAPDYTDAILARTASIGQRPGWAFPGSWFIRTSGDSMAGTPGRSWWLIAVVALVVLALAAGAVVVGSLQSQWRESFGQTRGLIAYASEGDIYLGDPITGSTLAIVSGPALDSRPMFSPDGSRIAIQRGDRDAGTAAIIVMRPDGSDQRVITPELDLPRGPGPPGRGHAQGDLAFAWTPDGASVVVAEWSLTVYDALGAEEPRDIASLLPGAASLGFDPLAQVAGFVRPATGDLLYGECGGLSAVDPDGTDPRVLVHRSWPRLGPRDCFVPSGPTWSPDASRIVFIDRVESDPYIEKAYVVDADGSDLRRLAVDRAVPVGHVNEQLPVWSPDGSKIAIQRTHVDEPLETSWITIVDFESGAERELEVTRSSFISNSGWSWSPDGRSILVLMQEGTHPLIVDIETGRATDLPWAADSPPSWQQVASD